MTEKISGIYPYFCREIIKIIPMDKWTREQTIVAFNVYCKIPFKASSKTHPLIVKYAKLIGRSPSALNMKVGNFGRLDPALRVQGITGLVHGAKMEEKVWNEFYGNSEKLAYESERLIAQFAGKPIELSSGIDITNLPQGSEREVVIKQRVNQSFFRQAVITSYDGHCCISGIGNPQLLEACHIVGWAQDEHNRTNPRNGLCMNPFFHKAYDNYFIAITPDLLIDISEELISKTTDGEFKNYLKNLSGKEITKPSRFLPQQELLDIHYNEYKARL